MSPALQVGSLPAESPEKPKNTGVVAYPFSSRSSRPRSWTGVSCIVGGLFTSWGAREAHGLTVLPLIPYLSSHHLVLCFLIMLYSVLTVCLVKRHVPTWDPFSFSLSPTHYIRCKMYLDSSSFFFFFSFWHHHMACRILFLPPGTELMPPAVEVWNLTHWSARELPQVDSWHIFPPTSILTDMSSPDPTTC